VLQLDAAEVLPELSPSLPVLSPLITETQQQLSLYKMVNYCDQLQTAVKM